MNNLPDNLTFSNPRKEATIENWPFGSKRCTAKFVVESDPKKGERVSRTTSDLNGGWNKPKLTTYSKAYLIVDGSDGKTYLLRYVDTYGFISVESADMKLTLFTVHQQDARFSELADIFAFSSYKIVK